MSLARFSCLCYSDFTINLISTKILLYMDDMLLM